MPRDKDSVLRTVIVATVLCIVCSVLVSSAAVVLRPKQETNRKLDRVENILSVVGIDAKGKDAAAIFEERIEERVIDIETGEDRSDIDPAAFDPRAASRDVAQTVPIPRDVAYDPGFKRREKAAIIYLVKGEGGRPTALILPVYGKGLWGTMYGFLALDTDLNTIRGLQFYEHIETPGLGGEVDNPTWRAQWKGKKAFGPEGEVRVEVIKGRVEPDKWEAAYQVDGLSGATITSRGVTNLIRYWLGDHGYGPYLSRIQEGGGLE